MLLSNFVLVFRLSTGGHETMSQELWSLPLHSLPSSSYLHCKMLSMCCILPLVWQYWGLSSTSHCLRWVCMCVLCFVHVHVCVHVCVHTSHSKWHIAFTAWDPRGQSTQGQVQYKVRNTPLRVYSEWFIAKTVGQKMRGTFEFKSQSFAVTVVVQSPSDLAKRSHRQPSSSKDS